LNGYLDKNATYLLGNNGSVSSGSSLHIGHYSGYGYFFNGTIDEVRISDGKTNITVSNTQYMHGKHSWNVTGASNQDVCVTQLPCR